MTKLTKIEQVIDRTIAVIWSTAKNDEDWLILYARCSSISQAFFSLQIRFIDEENYEEFKELQETFAWLEMFCILRA